MPENWLRRQAVQIVAQLPEDPNDAVIVLELAKNLVEGFLKDQPVLPLERPEGAVVPFPASASSR